jgi:hypothetical protein
MDGCLAVWFNLCTIASGSGPDHTSKPCMSSYRSELGGILAALYIIHRICQYYQISSGFAILYCDNRGAIANAFKTLVPSISSTLRPDYDLLSLTQYLVGEWVKGHYAGKDKKATTQIK